MPACTDFLRRASEPLGDAVEELDYHLDYHLGFHRFLAKLTPRNSTVLPPSRPVGRPRQPTSKNPPSPPQGVS